MASNGQARSQLPRPRQPQRQALSPPKATAALWQFIGPSYSKFIFAELRPARQPTKATVSVFGVRETPRMSATAWAVALPPATHPVASAFPAAMASARPRQPAKPQAPQFEPGRAPSTCSIFGSRCTWNARLEKPSSVAKATPSRPRARMGTMIRMTLIGRTTP